MRWRVGAVVRRLRTDRPSADPESLEQRVGSLETAVAENTVLHGPLLARVASLEQDVLVVLQQRSGRAGPG